MKFIMHWLKKFRRKHRGQRFPGQHHGHIYPPVIVEPGEAHEGEEYGATAPREHEHEHEHGHHDRD